MNLADAGILRAVKISTANKPQSAAPCRGPTKVLQHRVSAQEPCSSSLHREAAVFHGKDRTLSYHHSIVLAQELLVKLLGLFVIFKLANLIKNVRKCCAGRRNNLRHSFRPLLKKKIRQRLDDASKQAPSIDNSLHTTD